MKSKCSAEQGGPHISDGGAELTLCVLRLPRTASAVRVGQTWDVEGQVHSARGSVGVGTSFAALARCSLLYLVLPHYARGSP